LNFDSLTKLTKKIHPTRNESNIIFPNFNVDGFYDFYSQVIILNSKNEDDVRRLKEATESGEKLTIYQEIIKILPLMHHEYAHWIDHCSTLWGMQFLYELWDCYTTQLRENGKNGEENEYYKKINLLDKFVKIKFPFYYSTKGKSIDNKRWNYEYSVGKLFDKTGRPSNYPIFFSRFKDSAGQLIARQPISLSSLLETSATYQELALSGALLESLDVVEKRIESDFLKTKFESKLYSPYFTEYTVCAHVLANSFTKSEVVDTYRLASVLSRLVLNFPNESFKTINSNLVYKDINEFSGAFKISFNNKDRGALFFYLINFIGENYDHQNLEPEKITDIIKDALSKICPDENELEDKSNAEFSYWAKSLKELDTPYLNYLSDIGKFNHSKLKFYGKSEYIILDLKVPGVVLGDDTYFCPYGNKELNVGERYMDLSSFGDHLESFKKACIV